MLNTNSKYNSINSIIFTIIPISNILTFIHIFNIAKNTNYFNDYIILNIFLLCIIFNNLIIFNTIIIFKICIFVNIAQIIDNINCIIILNFVKIILLCN